MLPKHRRIHTDRQFKKVRRKGKVWKSPSFLAMIDSTKQSDSRLGIIVTTKMGKAVKRKRISRVLRHGFAQTITQPGLDIVLVARPLAFHKTTTQIAQELDRMVKTLRL